MLDEITLSMRIPIRELTSSGNAELPELTFLSSDLIKLRFAPSNLATRRSCTEYVNNTSKVLPCTHASSRRADLQGANNTESTARNA